MRRPTMLHHRPILAAAFCLAATLTPLRSLAPQASAATESNVVYGMVSGAALLMDVYHPAEPNGIGIVWIWGSGWQAPRGNQRWQLKARGVWPLLLDAGYTVFVINHRAAPVFRYPAAVEDAQRAVRFIRHNAQRFGIDADRIGGLGYSSGGHLVGLLATMDGAGAPDDTDPVERESAKLQAAVLRAGPTSLGEFDGPRGMPSLVSFMGFNPDPNAPEYQKASPITHVTPDDPPMLLIHGDQDQVVPFQQAEVMYGALQSAGVESKLIRVPGAGHFGNDPGEAFRWLNLHLLGPEAVAALEPLAEADEEIRVALMKAAEGAVDEAVAEYQTIVDGTPRYTITAGLWNRLCWWGGLWNRAEAVIHACDRAVAMDPDWLEYQDSRGLVRALLGDTEGAIRDFEFFLDRVQNPMRKAQRQAWVDALRAGENPFTPELLEELRG